VVGKLILLIILGFVAALYFPESRQMMIDEAMPVLHPVLVWSAEREMEVLSRSVRREARETYQLPQTRAWGAWLASNFTGDAATDPWGKTYSYQAWADSFAIRSDGPDGERGNGDDLRVAWRRPF
jgi:hypothetical protein